MLGKSEMYLGKCSYQIVVTEAGQKVFGVESEEEIELHASRWRFSDQSKPAKVSWECALKAKPTKVGES